MIYNATTNELNLFLFFFFFLLLLYFRLFSPVDEFVSLYVREKKTFVAAISRLYQVRTWWGKPECGHSGYTH